MSTRPIHRPRPTEAGSAYVLTLLALLVLTVLGLSLALITQSEVEVGGNERQINRVFYTADAAIGLRVASYKPGGDLGALTFDVADPGSSISKTHVTVSPMIPINTPPLFQTEINQNSDYAAITYQFNVAATRVNTDGADEAVIARKNLELMMEIQPDQPKIDPERANEGFSLPPSGGNVVF